MLQSHNLTKIFRIKHTFIKIVGWINILFCAFFAVMSWRAGATPGVSFIFVFFITLGVYLVLASGDMEADSESIRLNLSLAKYRINWSDIEYIEVDQQYGNMAFFGNGKVLNIIGPAGWSGNEKQEMINFIFHRIDELGIEVRQTQKAMFRLSKNTKI